MTPGAPARPLAPAGGPLDWIDGELQALEERGLRRTMETIAPAQGPVVEVAGRPLVNLCSNDYLGLASDARLARAAAEAALRCGAGSGAARLVSGDLPIHGELEQALAALKGTEAALLFSTGTHANLGAIPALAGPGDAVFSDELNHASIVDGCRLSRAQVAAYPHADAGALERLLRATRARRRLVVTDAVFSMEGDAAPLEEIAEVCRRHGAMLYVDEAHSTGLFGRDGGGLVEALGLTGRVDVIMGTLGKALGCFGAFTAGSSQLRDYLVCRARTFVFTTGLPPPVCGAALAALEVVRREPERRAHLAELQRRMKSGLEALGFPLPAVVAPIYPVVLGEEQAALAASRRLRERGFHVRAIRPPTVPPGTSRLRVTLTASHTVEQVDGFLAALGEVLREPAIR